MGGLSKIFTTFLLASSISFAEVPLVSADNAGAIINLFGTIIKQDMQNREQKRQQQQRINEIREQEILAIKRVQRYLKQLGFYDKKIDGDAGSGTKAAIRKYMNAFNIGDFQLNDYSIGQLEDHARSGFISASEVASALRGDFKTASELNQAKRGGFTDARTFRTAQTFGFQNLSEYREFERSGFKNRAELLSAKALGFKNRRNRDLAKNAGFDNNKEYQGFIKSGLKSREEYLVANNNKIEFLLNRSDCVTHTSRNSWGKAVLACQKAYSNDPSDKQILALVKKAIDGNLATVFSLQEESKRIEEDIVDLEAKLIGNTDTAKKIKYELEINRLGYQLRANTTKLDGLSALKDRLACEEAYAAEQWRNALQACSAATKIVKDQRLSKLLEVATRQLKEAEDIAVKETARLALEDAKKKSKLLLFDIDDFTNNNGAFSNGLLIARALVELRNVQNAQEAKTIEVKFANLEQAITKEISFQSFIDKRFAADAVAAANAKALAVEVAEVNSDFLVSYISKNVTSSHVSELLKLSGQIDEAVTSKSFERVALVNKIASKTFSRLQLNQNRKVFIENAAVKGAVEKEADDLFKALNGLAITDENRVLLDGAAGDLVLVYNTLPSAPNVALNLLGNVVFANDLAKACWFHNDRPQELKVRLLLSELVKVGAIKVDEIETCRRNEIYNHDLILLERSKLLQMPLQVAQPFIRDFVAGKYEHLLTIEDASFNKLVAGSPEDGQSIRRDVEEAAIVGFGFIAVENNSSNMCIVVDNYEDAHDAILADFSENLTYLLKGVFQARYTNLETAFVHMQKHQCGTLYTSSSNLKLVLNAMDQQSIPNTVLPLWVSQELFDGAVLKIADEQARGEEIASKKRDKLLKQQATEKQRLEGEKLIAESKSQEKANQDRLLQEKLRSENGADARAAFAQLKSIMLAGFGQDTENVGGHQQSFIIHFGALNEWFGTKQANGWEIDEINIAMTDYGKSIWQERRLNSVFSITNIRIKNRLLGSYEDHCFETGFMIDSEFELNRFPVDSRCDLASLALGQWKQGNSFESLWLAH